MICLGYVRDITYSWMFCFSSSLPRQSFVCVWYSQGHNPLKCWSYWANPRWTYTGRVFAFWLFMFKSWIPKCIVQWPLMVLYGVHVISAILSACLQEATRKPSPCLPCSILQAQRKAGTQRPLITSLIWTAAGESALNANHDLLLQERFSKNLLLMYR